MNSEKDVTFVNTSFWSLNFIYMKKKVKYVFGHLIFSEFWN